MLKSALSQNKPWYSVAELRDLASHCTDQENAAKKVERQVRKSAAALMLSNRIGEIFDATVISRSKAFSTIQIHEPAVVATITDPAELGSAIRVRLDAADVEGPTVRFTAVSGAA